MKPSREERRAALVRKFREVGRERLSRLVQGWLQIEQGAPGPEVAAELFRELHTFKGEARTVGLGDLAEVAHMMEEVLFKIRDAGFTSARASADQILFGFDTLSLALGLEGPPPPEWKAQAEARLRGQVAPPPATPTDALATPGDALAAAVVPSAPVSSASVPALAAQVPHASPFPEMPAIPQRRSADETLRVRQERIVRLGELAGELQIHRSKNRFVVTRINARIKRLETMVEELNLAAHGSHAVTDRAAELLGQARAAGRDISELDELTYRTGLQIEDLDRQVRDLRLIPVSALTDSYARIVRDAANTQNKRAIFALSGGELEADKRVLEGLQEPLGHLIQNAIDHGIESSPEREALGKTPHGTLHLAAAQRGGFLVLRLEDDGRGLDLKRIRQKAIDGGLVRPETLAGLDDSQIAELVFLPGLTTRDEASLTAGRGVGMDVVKRRVEELGGHVRIKSRPGLGTEVELLVPLSLSLTRALIIRVGSRCCAIPSLSVERLSRMVDEQILPSHGGPKLKSGQDLLPIYSLEELLGVGSGAGEEGGLLVIRSGTLRCGVKVRHVEQELDLVVKPLGPPMQRFSLISGAAVLPDGELALVLDAGALLGLRHGAARASEDSAAERTSLSVLVVDDSVIARSAVADLVRALGHRVTAAQDGRSGLAVVEAENLDVVITDIEMPGMDGIELIKRIRALERTRGLPIVVLSSLGSAADRARAMGVGANAYLVKSQLDDETVAQTLQRVVG